MKLVTTIDDWLSRRTGGVTPRKKELKLFTTIYDDARLLGHFLAHYDRAGVTQFFIAVAKGHGSAVRPFMPAYRITICEELGVADKCPFGVNAATEMRRRYQDPDAWAVMVDLDESVEFPKPIFDITADAQKEGANIVQGIMYDRFSADGKPRSFDASSDLSAKPQLRVAEKLEAEFNQSPNILPRKYTEAKKLIAKHSTPYRLVASGIH